MSVWNKNRVIYLSPIIFHFFSRLDFYKFVFVLIKGMVSELYLFPGTNV